MSLKLGLRNKIRRSRAGGFTGLLDQPFATGATAAYSLRRLKSTATKAVRVREDSGNTETDIGFSGGTLDETALLNHVGSNNAFVTKWYDQSGNGNDASNSTASGQPQIVSSGSIIKENGKPALDFDGNDDKLISGNVVSDSNLSLFVVKKNLNLQNTPQDLISQTAAVNGFKYGVSKSGADQYATFFNNGNNAFALTAEQGTIDYELHEVFVDSNECLIYVNDIQEANDTGEDYSVRTNSANLALGERDNNNFFNGYMQEALVYLFNKKSNRSKIKTSINKHYSIF